MYTIHPSTATISKRTFANVEFDPFPSAWQLPASCDAQKKPPAQENVAGQQTAADLVPSPTCRCPVAHYEVADEFQSEFPQAWSGQGSVGADQAAFGIDQNEAGIAGDAAFGIGGESSAIFAIDGDRHAHLFFADGRDKRGR